MLSERDRSQPLSYLQLVEVAFVATLRHMGVPLKRIRVARDYLAKRFETDYPFARLDLKTDGATVLYDLGQEQGEWVTDLLMVDAGAAGQTIWADPIRERIQEFDYDGPLRLAIRWFPRGRDALVVVDPQIQFGAPILRDHGLATAVVRERYEAGDTIPEIEDDYGIDSACVRYALEFEGVTLAAAA